jgi:hypothetical protein
MLDSQDLLEHADRCRSLANLTRMPEVADRLRKLAQRYADQARDSKLRRMPQTQPLIEAEQTALAPNGG